MEEGFQAFVGVRVFEACSFEENLRNNLRVLVHGCESAQFALDLRFTLAFVEFRCDVEHFFSQHAVDIGDGADGIASGTNAGLTVESGQGLLGLVGCQIALLLEKFLHCIGAQVLGG